MSTRRGFKILESEEPILIIYKTKPNEVLN